MKTFRVEFEKPDRSLATPLGEFGSGGFTFHTSKIYDVGGFPWFALSLICYVLFQSLREVQLDYYTEYGGEWLEIYLSCKKSKETDWNCKATIKALIDFPGKDFIVKEKALDFTSNQEATRLHACKDYKSLCLRN